MGDLRICVVKKTPIAILVHFTILRNETDRVQSDIFNKVANGNLPHSLLNMFSLDLSLEHCISAHKVIAACLLHQPTMF